MGAWGTGVFDNDAALDWFDALEQRGADAVLVALQTIPEEADSIEVDHANEALAAAEIVAACRARASPNLPGEASDWIGAHETEIGPELLPLAIDAVTRIRTESELKDLWEEGDSAAEWLAVIDDLLGRLREGGSGEAR